MKKLLSILLLTCLSLSVFAQSKVTLTGNIGPYSIEMQLQSTHGAEMPIGGRYNYKGKTAHLDLEGNYYPGGIVFLEESWEGEVTGRFYLDYASGSEYVGTWVGNGKSHRVELKVQSGDLTSLEARVEEEDVSNGIAGTYGRARYFINDMFFSEDNPEMDIGFNGGEANVFVRGKDSIEVEFDFVCGPTYHIASFRGVAGKVADRKYVYNASMYEGDEPCHLIFEFKDKTLVISQESAGIDCGFGARAYADGEFPKVSNTPQTHEEY